MVLNSSVFSPIFFDIFKNVQTVLETIFNLLTDIHYVYIYITYIYIYIVYCEKRPSHSYNRSWKAKVATKIVFRRGDIKSCTYIARDGSGSGGGHP